jgi:hypothetical protein
MATNPGCIEDVAENNSQRPTLVLPFAAGLEDRLFYHKERPVNFDCDVPISLVAITQERFARLELALTTGNRICRLEGVNDTIRP